jgi:hypothetical protein
VVKEAPKAEIPSDAQWVGSDDEISLGSDTEEPSQPAEAQGVVADI